MAIALTYGLDTPMPGSWLDLLTLRFLAHRALVNIKCFRIRQV